jgi:Predicted nucleic acid-binding protein, contains PIN domain
MYVFDATPLIYLATVDRLSVVDALPDDCCVPDAVYGEVVTTGIEAGHTDARRIEQAVEAGRFEVEPAPETDLHERLGRTDNLSGADIAVLTLAGEHDGTAVMDEQYGRTVAETEDIETRGTAFVVLNALAEGEMTASAAHETVDGMLDAGWYCSPDLFRGILAKIDELDE